MDKIIIVCQCCGRRIMGGDVCIECYTKNPELAEEGCCVGKTEQENNDESS